jgi:hypothetical protein
MVPAAPWLVPALTRSAAVVHWAGPDAAGAEVVGVPAGDGVLAGGVWVTVTVAGGEAVPPEDATREARQRAPGAPLKPMNLLDSS